MTTQQFDTEISTIGAAEKYKLHRAILHVGKKQNYPSAKVWTRLDSG